MPERRTRAGSAAARRRVKIHEIAVVPRAHDRFGRRDLEPGRDHRERQHAGTARPVRARRRRIEHAEEELRHREHRHHEHGRERDRPAITTCAALGRSVGRFAPIVWPSRCRGGEAERRREHELDRPRCGCRSRPSPRPPGRARWPSARTRYTRPRTASRSAPRQPHARHAEHAHRRPVGAAERERRHAPRREHHVGGEHQTCANTVAHAAPATPSRETARARRCYPARARR